MNPRGIQARHFRGIQEGFRPGSPSDHSMARCGYRSIILYCPRVVDCPRVVYCPRVTSSLPERCYISESDQSSKFKGKRFGFTVFENQLIKPLIYQLQSALESSGHPNDKQN